MRDARAETLDELVTASGVDANALITSTTDPASAVTEHARRLDADIVVIGAHASERKDGDRRRTANALVESLDQSVFVVPMPVPRYAM